MDNKFAIDVTWVRHGIVGGTESYIINLLKGFMMTDDSFEIMIFAAKDNAKYFSFVKKDKRFSVKRCNVCSSNVFKRIIWQNMCLSKEIKKSGYNICFEPVYAKPIFFNSGIKYISVIHDLHALYFPEQLSKLTNIWLRIAWKNTTKTSYKIVGITDFVVNDIVKRYKVDKKKITRIYNPIFISNDSVDFSSLKNKYGIENNKYFFTVSKLNKHKNLSILIPVIREIVKNNQFSDFKLVISGPKGAMLDELNNLIKLNNVEKNVVITGFVSDSERNSLYANCYEFLFPSVFEGFGMPPIEAMFFGKHVICTNKTCMPEVTQNKAFYICNPSSVSEWVSVISKSYEQNVSEIDLSIYNPKIVAQQYLKWILE